MGGRGRGALGSSVDGVGAGPGDGEGKTGAGGGSWTGAIDWVSSTVAGAVGSSDGPAFTLLETV